MRTDNRFTALFGKWFKRGLERDLEAPPNCCLRALFSASRVYFVAVFSLITLTAPVVLAQKATSTFDSNFSFSEHRRYAWRENRLITRQHPDTNELMDLKIVRKVNEALAARGFEEVKDKPDFYIYYDGGGNMDLYAGSQEKANSAPLNPADRTPTYGAGNGPGLAPATWLKVNGQIIFHITDAGSGKSVWETTYKKTFRDPDRALRNWDKEVDELVTKSFKDFPPKNKK
jgi:hypothetical protein